MNNIYKKELTIAQQKLNAINTLSNCIQNDITKKQKDDIAYAIHQIIDAKDFTSDIARLVTSIQIQSSDILVKV